MWLKFLTQECENFFEVRLLHLRAFSFLCQCEKSFVQFQLILSTQSCHILEFCFPLIVWITWPLVRRNPAAGFAGSVVFVGFACLGVNRRFLTRTAGWSGSHETGFFFARRKFQKYFYGAVVTHTWKRSFKNLSVWKYIQPKHEIEKLDCFNWCVSKNLFEKLSQRIWAWNCKLGWLNRNITNLRDWFIIVEASEIFCKNLASRKTIRNFFWDYFIITVIIVINQPIEWKNQSMNRKRLRDVFLLQNLHNSSTILESCINLRDVDVSC